MSSDKQYVGDAFAVVGGGLIGLALFQSPVPAAVCAVASLGVYMALFSANQPKQTPLPTNNLYGVHKIDPETWVTGQHATVKKLAPNVNQVDTMHSSAIVSDVVVDELRSRFGAFA